MNNISQAIIDKAINQVKTSFTTDVMPLSMTPANNNHFVVSIVNVRCGAKIVIDYTFTIKTAKIVKSEVIEKTYC